MARTTGVIGTFNGKLGAAVFANRRGINYARAYQPNVANPKSARQELSRARMALAVKTVKGVLEFVRDGYRLGYPTYQMQRAISKMVPTTLPIITQQGGTLRVDYDVLNYALSANDMGAITSVQNPRFIDEGKVGFSVTVPESMFYDIDGTSVGCGVEVCVYVPDLDACAIGRFVCPAPVDGASTVAEDVTVPALWSGLRGYVYAFAKQIPNAYNGIAADTIPWKFPSRTSRCEFLGDGMLP